jgi:hypothetical protein
MAAHSAGVESFPAHFTSIQAERRPRSKETDANSESMAGSAYMIITYGTLIRPARGDRRSTEVEDRF